MNEISNLSLKQIAMLSCSNADDDGTSSRTKYPCAAARDAIETFVKALKNGNDYADASINSFNQYMQSRGYF